MQERGIAQRRLLVARGQTPVVLDTIEKAPHLVAVLVELLIDLPLLMPVLLARNY